MVIKNQTFPIYGTMIITAIIVSLLYMFIVSKKEKISTNNFFSYMLLYFACMFMFGIKINITQNSGNIQINSLGLYSYGCGIGVLAAAILFEKIKPTNNKILKYTFFSLPLTYAIGKIGCFFAGCCYGIPYEGFLAINYVDKLQFNVFPVQLLETITFGIIFIICNALRNNKNVVYITVVVSAIAKFGLDYLRYDHVHENFTFNQKFSIFLIVITGLIYIYNKIKEKKYGM